MTRRWFFRFCKQKTKVCPPLPSISLRKTAKRTRNLLMHSPDDLHTRVYADSPAGGPFVPSLPCDRPPPICCSKVAFLSKAPQQIRLPWIFILIYTISDLPSCLKRTQEKPCLGRRSAKKYYLPIQLRFHRKMRIAAPRWKRLVMFTYVQKQHSS